MNPSQDLQPYEWYDTKKQEIEDNPGIKFINSMGKVIADFKSAKGPEDLNRAILECSAAFIAHEANILILDQSLREASLPEENLILVVLKKLFEERMIEDDNVNSNIEPFFVVIFFLLDVKRVYFEAVYQSIGEMTITENIDKFSPILYNRALKILKILYMHKNNEQLYPNCFFSLTKQNAMIEVHFDKKEKKFDPFQGFSIQLWFYLEPKLNLCKEGNEAVIFRIFTDEQEGFEICVIEGMLVYRVYTSKKNQGIARFPLSEVKSGRWNFLCVNQEYSAWRKMANFSYCLNNDHKEREDIPKFGFSNPKRHNLFLRLGGQMIGRITNVFLMNKFDAILKDQHAKSIDFGVTKPKDFKDLDLYFSVENLKTKPVCLLIAPSFVTFHNPLERQNKCFVYGLNELRAGLEVNFTLGAGILYKSNSNMPVNRFGGFGPILELLRYSSNLENVRHIIDILTKILRGSELNQSLAAEFGLAKAIVGYIEPLSKLLTEQAENLFIPIIAEISNKVLIKQFMRYFFLNFYFLEGLPYSFQQKAEDFCIEFYHQYPLAMQLIPLEEIIKYIVIHESLDSSHFYMEEEKTDEIKSKIYDRKILGMRLVEWIILNEEMIRPDVTKAIELILECITLPHLSPCLHNHLLKVMRLVLMKNPFKLKEKHPFLEKLIPSLLLFIKHSSWPKQTIYAIKLMHLIHRSADFNLDLEKIHLVLIELFRGKPLSDKIESKEQVLQEHFEYDSDSRYLMDTLYEFLFSIAPVFEETEPFVLQEKTRIVNPKILNILMALFQKFEFELQQKFLQDILTLFSYSFENTSIAYKNTNLLAWVTRSSFYRFVDEPLELNEKEKGILDLQVKLMDTILYQMFKHSKNKEFIVVLSSFLAETESLIKQDIGNECGPNEYIRDKMEAIRSRVLTQLLKTIYVNLDVLSQKPASINHLMIEIIHYIFGDLVESTKLSRKVSVNEANEALEEEVEEVTNPEEIKTVETIPLPTLIQSESYKSEGAGSKHLQFSKIPKDFDILDRDFLYSICRDCARVRGTEKDSVWIDKKLGLTLLLCFKHYYYVEDLNGIQELIQQKKEIIYNGQLLEKNKRIAQKPRVIKTIIILLCFILDHLIEIEDVETLRIMTKEAKRIIINCVLTSEIEQAGKKPDKVKIMDSSVIFILLFFSSRQTYISEEKSELKIGFTMMAKEIWLLMVDLFKHRFYAIEASNRSSFIIEEETDHSKPGNISDSIFFAKNRVLDTCVTEITQVETMIAENEIFNNTMKFWRQNQRIKDLLESEFGQDFVTISQTLRFDLKCAMKQLVDSKNQLYKKGMETASRVLSNLEKKLILNQDEVQRKFERSMANGETIIRECRTAEHANCRECRGPAGMWVYKNILKFYQKDSVFRSTDYKFGEWEGNKYFRVNLHEWTAKQLNRPFIRYKLKKYWWDPLEEFAKIVKPHSEYTIFNRGIGLHSSLKSKGALKDSLKGVGKKVLKFFEGNSGAIPNSEEIKEKEISDTIETEEVLFSRACEWYRKFAIIDGSLYITEKELVFVTDNAKSKNYLSLLNYHKKYHESVRHSWKIANIREVQRRRLVQRQSGIEIFFLDGYSVLFNFPINPKNVDDVHNFLSKLLSSIKEAKIVQLKTNPPTKANKKLFEKLKFTDKWLKGEISNFEYLMRCNSYSGRSFHNLSQYPVFPWVLVYHKSVDEFKEEGIAEENLEKLEEEIFKGDMTEIEFNDLDKETRNGQFNVKKFLECNILRTFSKSMGSMGSKYRTNHFMERFAAKDMFSDVPPYFYGSHYTSPAITLHFMIRTAPYTEAAKALQNGVFDLADRLFFSVRYAYRNAIEEMSDVRELIPEFYCIPEFLINFNKEDFGLSQSGERVDNVLLPCWAYNNPFFYIYFHRKLLESFESSINLNHWIDLVFGYKQTGIEAEKAMNIFYYLTYEGEIDMDEIPDSDRQAYETQVVHFGQTPSKLFKKAHPSKNLPAIRSISSVNCPESDLSIFRKSANKDSKHNPGKRVVKSFYDYKLKATYLISTRDFKTIMIIKNGMIEIYKWIIRDRKEQESNKTTKAPFILKKIDTDTTDVFFRGVMRLTDNDYQGEQISAIIDVIHSHNWILVGGFITGLIKIRVVGKKDIFVVEGHTSTVTSIKVDRTERYVVSGSKDGIVIIWEIRPDTLSILHRIYDFDSKVNDIYITYDSLIVGIATSSGRLGVYNVVNGERMAIFIHPMGYQISKISLSLYPFGSIAFFSPTDRILFVYSMSGQYLGQRRLTGRLLDLKVSNDCQHFDIIVAAMESGDLLIANMPFMEFEKVINPSEKSCVSNFITLDKSEVIIAGDGDGDTQIIFSHNAGFIYKAPVKNK